MYNSARVLFNNSKKSELRDNEYFIIDLLVDNSAAYEMYMNSNAFAQQQHI